MVKRYQAKLAEGKGTWHEPWEKTGAKLQAQKSRPPVGTHRMYFFPPIMNCDITYEILPTREAY